MTTIGILGAGEVGSQLARAAVAAAADVAVIAFPYRPADELPVAEFRSARPAGAPDRHALVVSSDHPEAVGLVTRLYDRFGFDTVVNSPLSESWRSTPGTPMWAFHHVGESREALIAHLARATRGPRP